MTKQSRMRMGADRKLLITIIVAVVAMLGILAVNTDRVYATDYSGTVYFNLSDDGKPVMSDVTGDPMMMVPVDLQAVADVDLAEWGLEDYAYQEYGGDGTQDPERPTALKLYLYMHEQYKDDPQNSITVTGSVHSAYMSMFWGMDENLNYYVNGAYPLFEGGWGATCDGIALEDGDRVDVMHFSDWSFWTDAMAGFNFFADANSDPGDGAIVETYDAVVGEPLPVQVIRGYGSLAIGGATEYQAADDLAIHVSGKNSLIDLNDEEVGTLDGGTAELTFDEPGLYYIWVEGGEGENGTIVQSAAAAMVDVTAGENRKPKLATGVSATEDKSINPSQKYTVDLSRIFTDPEGDPLTYKVSVDGDDYVACDKDYVYTPAGEGAVTLKFKANDGQVDSDDTYTVNLTVYKDKNQDQANDQAKARSTAKKVLVAKAVAKGNKKAKISWNNVKADRYVIYLSRCDHQGKSYKLKKVKTVNGKTRSWTKGKLKKNVWYKFKVVAQKKVNGKYKTIATSKVSHFVTANVRGTETNPKSLKLNKSKVNLKKGKSVTIKAKVTKVKKKKALATGHTKKLRYISSDPKIATVNAKGKVTGKKAGTCTIYVQASNGVWKTCKVTVK